MNHRLNLTAGGLLQIIRISFDAHKDRSKAFIVVLAALVVLCAGRVTAQDASSSTAAPDYDQLVSQAANQLKEGNLDDARQTVRRAILLNSSNYLGYAVEAKIAARQGKSSEVHDLVQTALDLAPAEEKDKIRQLAALINTDEASPQSAPKKLSDEDQLKLDGLMLILDNADKAQNANDRTSAYRDFLTRSEDFAVTHREQTNVWLMRAFACVELDYPGEGYLAGQHLKALGAIHSEDPKVHHVLAELESKGWLGDKRTYRDWSKWTTDQVKAAASDGDEEAQTAMGDWYFDGSSGLNRDYAQAANWYCKAAEQGNAWCEFRLGWLYEKGWGEDQGYTQAFNWYRKSADQGLDVAQNNLGWLYRNGQGVTRDYGQALMWFRKAAEQGNSQSEDNLGDTYLNGWGVDKDYAQAASWYRKSADQGNSNGENDLGIMYQNGWGVDKDYAQALSWYRKSADQGNSNGENDLGVMYHNGWGVNEDYAQALSWYRKSADQGNASGEANLGLMYQNGWGVDKDYAQALGWYRKSADQGNASGEANLGFLYEAGLGVDKSLNDALIWYRKAATQGNDYAQKTLKRLNADQQAVNQQ